jgi:hypothetical protein
MPAGVLDFLQHRVDATQQWVSQRERVDGHASF